MDPEEFLPVGFPHRDGDEQFLGNGIVQIFRVDPNPRGIKGIGFRFWFPVQISGRLTIGR